jgi:hypothetical protein
MNMLFAIVLKFPMKTMAFLGGSKCLPGSLPLSMQVAAGATTVFLGVENAAETTAAVLSIAAAVGVPGGKPTIRKKKRSVVPMDWFKGQNKQGFNWDFPIILPYPIKEKTRILI